MSHISAGKGTPIRPGPVDAYLFSLVDEDAKSIAPGNFECHWGIFYFMGSPKYYLNLSTTNSGTLIPAQGVQYQAHQWCIFTQSTKLGDPNVAPSISYTCTNGACASLGYGTSCSCLNAAENISHAFNSYYQINNQLDDACKFLGLVWSRNLIRRWGTCKVNTMIQPYYGDARRDCGLFEKTSPLSVCLTEVLPLTL